MGDSRVDWKRWLFAGGIAAVMLALVLQLFRLPETDSNANAASRPAGVTLAPGSDPLLTEEARLRDPTPLFLPTRWNASENALPSGVRREPGSSFRLDPPALKLAGTELRSALPPVVVAPAAPADALAVVKTPPPFVGLGQMDRDVAALRPRGAFLEVSLATDGQVVIAQPLTGMNPPADAGWQPLGFLVAVDETGLVRPAVLTDSSSVAAVDSFFQDYLANGFRIGERLPPGFYRVSIGP